MNAARALVWEQRGRGSGAFGARELLNHLGGKGPSDADLPAQVER